MNKELDVMGKKAVVTGMIGTYAVGGVVWTLPLQLHLRKCLRIITAGPTMHLTAVAI